MDVCFLDSYKGYGLFKPSVSFESIQIGFEGSMEGQIGEEKSQQFIKVIDNV